MTKDQDDTPKLRKAMFEHLVRLPSDFVSYGGQIDRDAKDDNYSPDCSSGCRYFAKLAGTLGYEWGICSNPSGPRYGLLTFEHQAGHLCFEIDKSEPSWMSGPEWTEAKP